MRNKNPKGGSRGREVIVLQNAPEHHNLIKTNRVLLMLTSALMMFVFVVGFLFMPNFDLLDQVKQEEVVHEQALQNPAISAEINLLKTQMVGLVSGSIESKLRVLEQSVKAGSFHASLGTIEDLKNDVQVLKSYSNPQQQAAAEKNEVNEVLLQELTQLKKLVYLTIASCGLMIAAIGAVWVKNKYRIGFDGQRLYLTQKR